MFARFENRAGRGFCDHDYHFVMSGSAILSAASVIDQIVRHWRFDGLNSILVTQIKGPLGFLKALRKPRANPNPYSTKWREAQLGGNQEPTQKLLKRLTNLLAIDLRL
jgi:hypothetical protein